MVASADLVALLAGDFAFSEGGPHWLSHRLGHMSQASAARPRTYRRNVERRLVNGHEAASGRADCPNQTGTFNVGGADTTLRKPPHGKVITAATEAPALFCKNRHVDQLVGISPGLQERSAMPTEL